MPSRNRAPSVSTNHRQHLRWISIIGFPFAIILLVIHGTLTSKVVPALGLVPLFGSVVISSAVLYHLRKASPGSQVKPSIVLVYTILDFTLAAFDMAILVPTWLKMENVRHGGLAALAAYGTLFLLVDFAMHIYFIFSQLQISVHFSLGDAPSPSKPAMATRVGYSEYDPLATQDDEEEEEQEEREREIESGILLDK